MTTEPKKCCERCSNPHSDLVENCIEQGNCPCHTTKPICPHGAMEKECPVLGCAHFNTSDISKIIAIVQREERERIVKMVEGIRNNKTTHRMPDDGLGERLVIRESVLTDIINAVKGTE